MKKTFSNTKLDDYLRRTSYLLHRFKDEAKGVAAIEFAFIAPLMLIMYVGTMEVSNAVSANRKLSRVSSTVGDLLTQATCYTDAKIQDIIKVTDDIMYPYDNVVAIQLNSVKIENDIAKVEWSRGFNGAVPLSPGTVYDVPAKIKINGNYLLAAKIEMGYSPAIGWIKPDGKTSISIDDAPINMSEQMFLRPRVGDKIEIQGTCP